MLTSFQQWREGKTHKDDVINSLARERAAKRSGVDFSIRLKAGTHDTGRPQDNPKKDRKRWNSGRGQEE